jgi:hypothetical protein
MTRQLGRVLAMLTSALLVIAYAALAVTALRPHVGKHYRDYYLTHSVADWHVSTYSARMQDGIEFARDGWPKFVRSLSGLSHRESGGRWTDARLAAGASIRYRSQLSGDICVSFEVTPSRTNVGGISYVAVGNESLAFRTESPSAAWHQLSFTLSQPTHVLRIYPGLSERMSARDARRIGLKLQKLIVMPGACSPGGH